MAVAGIEITVVPVLVQVIALMLAAQVAPYLPASRSKPVAKPQSKRLEEVRGMLSAGAGSNWAAAGAMPHSDTPAARARRRSAASGIRAGMGLQRISAAGEITATEPRR